MLLVLEIPFLNVEAGFQQSLSPSRSKPSDRWNTGELLGLSLGDNPDRTSC